MPTAALMHCPNCKGAHAPRACPRARKPWRTSTRSMSERYGRDWPALRAQVLREEPACTKCGSDKNLTVDHIRNKANHGTDARDNLTTLCKDCQAAKASKEGAAARWRA